MTSIVIIPSGSNVKKDPPHVSRGRDGKLMNIIHSALAGLIGLGCAQVASAQIASSTLTAFNQAVETGDAAAIEVASTNLMNEAIANPDDPDALIAAYEAALKLCDIDCAAALPGAEFALGFPATGQHPIMAERELLAAFAAFSGEASRRTRARLEAALSNLQDPTLLSARAFFPLYLNHAERSNFDDAARVSGIAVEHLRPVRSSVPEFYFHALEAHATTLYLHEKSLESHDAIFRWNAEMIQVESMIALEDQPEWLRSNYWRSEAWANAARAFIESTTGYGDRVVSGFDRVDAPSENEIDEIYAEFPPVEQIVEDVDTRLPHCEGELIRPDDFSYPARAAYDGVIGSVIAKFRFDEEGRVLDVDVLAAVPPDVFDDSVLDASSSWYYQVAEGVDPSTCRLDHENVVLPITFQMR